MGKQVGTLDPRDSFGKYWWNQSCKNSKEM